MKWLRKAQARWKLYKFINLIAKTDLGKLTITPWIVVGESAGLYLAADDDVYCRWCGNRFGPHAERCPWITLSLEKWGQIFNELAG